MSSLETLIYNFDLATPPLQGNDAIVKEGNIYLRFLIFSIYFADLKPTAIDLLAQLKTFLNTIT